MVPLHEKPPASPSPGHKSTGGHNLLVREIEESDFEEASELLGRHIGYPRGYFIELFRRMTKLQPVAGYPKYGRALVSNGRIVGAIVLISSARTREGVRVVRCHVTGWAVETAF